MASAIKKVDKVRQIVQLKQVMKRWKTMSIGRRSNVYHSCDKSDSEESSSGSGSGSGSCSSSSSNRRIPHGFLAVYVGPERRRFVIPTRYLNLPIFVSLLKKSEEEFGFKSVGGLVFPCDAEFFKGVLKSLEKNEDRFRRMELDEFLKMFTEVGNFDSSCKDGKDVVVHGFTPLLPKTRA